MSNLLPFAEQGPTGQFTNNGMTAFSITLTDGGGTAIDARSFGTDSEGDTATGLYAESDQNAVWGQGINGGIAVLGNADTGIGVQGLHGNPNFYTDLPAGVQGLSGQVGIPGVFGGSDVGDGVQGTSRDSNSSGVNGTNTGGGTGVYGQSQGAGTGVFGISSGNDGVRGNSSSPEHAGVAANNSSQPTGKIPSGFGLWASSNNTGLYVKGTPAGYFDGDVLVSGDIVLLNSSGGDVAEDFDVEAEPLNAEPGTVLIINENGNLCASDTPYDTRVAGVVAGAGNLKPAVVLQRVQSRTPRSPIALVGKAFCKVDAAFGRVIAGDLLTTCATPGHAMKASDRSRALGAVIGKALAGMDGGLGLIPILVSPR